MVKFFIGIGAFISTLCIFSTPILIILSFILEWHPVIIVYLTIAGVFEIISFSTIFYNQAIEIISEKKSGG